MGSNLVIVALPSDDDRVWKISSEKKPHMTLCFLGEADKVQNLDTIMQFVQHATELSEHGPFYLDVDHRGTLGPDEADVLFFSKRSWNLRWINQFRSQLLQNQAIRTAYDSVPVDQQYPEWTPHLTLGYPTAPAKPLPNDGFEHPIYSVSFDRIAVWTGDFEGPDFRLEWPERDNEFNDVMAYSSLTEAHRKPSLDEALEHYGAKSDLVSHNDSRKALGLDSVVEHVGVKGMKWGQRKSPERQAAKAAKKVGKADKQFERQADSAHTWVLLHNSGADHVNAQIPKINAEFEKKHPKEMNDGTLLNDSHPVTRAYNKAYNDAFVEGLNKGADRFGLNASGTRKIKIMSADHETIDFNWAYKTAKVEHAQEDALVFVLVRDENGKVVRVETGEDSLTQTMDLGAAFLEHHGVKGMKWGQTREKYRTNLHNRRVAAEAATRENRPAQDVRAYPTIGPSKRTKAKVDTKGGEDHPPTDDAIKVAVARQKMKKSGLKALTNSELKDVANRLNLESQVMALENKQPKSRGKKFVESIFGNKKNQEAAGAFVGKQLAKKVAVAGL